MRRTKRSALVTRLESLPDARFGALVMHELPHDGLMGDVSIIHEHLPPRTMLPQVHHRHTSEFVYCVSGEMTAHLDGRRHRIRAGGVIQIPPGVRHKFTTASRSCHAVSIFRPALRVGPGADIHTEP